MNLMARGLITAAGTPRASNQTWVTHGGKATAIVAFLPIVAVWRQQLCRLCTIGRRAGRGWTRKCTSGPS